MNFLNNKYGIDFNMLPLRDYLQKISMIKNKLLLLSMRASLMKTIGLIGGMSWESTQLYYQQLNEGIKQHLGGLHSAKVVLYSVDFSEIEH